MGDPNKTTLVARLSKDGTRVLCDRINCGQTLADAVVNAGGALVTARTNGRRPGRDVDALSVFYRTGVPGASAPPDTSGPRADRCSIVFSAGWFPDTDGVWTRTKQSQKRYDADREIALGGSGVSARERERARQRILSDRSARFAHRAPPGVPGVRHPHHPEHRADLPCFARCPDCGGINVLKKVLIAEAIRRAGGSPPAD
jgi:hypothetical protein